MDPRNKNIRKSEYKNTEEAQSAVPSASMDYIYMSKQDVKAHDNPVLVMVNERTNERFARAVGNKGVNGGASSSSDDNGVVWLLKDCDEELKAWGYTGGPNGSLILTCDGERPIRAFRDILAKHHGGIVIPEGPAKGESQSMGNCEGQ